MKKIISIIISLVLVINAFCTLDGVSASAETFTCGDYEYELLADGTAEITKYIGSSTNAVIPSSIGSYSVTSIGEYAFANCYKISTLTIPDSVTSIKNGAFYGCSGLGGVTIPDSVTSIGDYPFYNCKNLKSVIIGNSVTSIGSNAFFGCLSLTSVTIGNSVTSIGAQAFGVCSSLTSITIPDSVTSIGNSAFRNCSSLKSITIPDSVTCIEMSTFQECTGLTSITIPDSVTSIGKDAFYNCKSLISVKIPNGVTSISDYAFYHCSKLTDVTIPSSVKSIGLYAFYYCIKLESITIPNSVTSIGEYAFEYCQSLVMIEIPTSVTKVGDYAFYGCNNLLIAFIPKNLNYSQNTFPSQTEIRFEKIKFTITFDANGGSNAPQELTLTADSMQAYFNVPNQIPVRRGYTFAGWSEEQYGSAIYLPGKTYTINKSLTLYAIWEIAYKYTINYDLCGGNGNIPGQQKAEGIDLELSSIIPTHTNYIFAYWISSDRETIYYAGSTYKADANDTLYAAWKEVCPKCNGSPYSSTRCDKCHGTKYTSTTCDKCKGSKYSSIKKCSRCNGKGILTYTLTCDKCKGTGTISKTRTETCPLCKGNGYRIKDGNFEVCYLCSGMGEVTRNVQETCKNCGGDGQKDNEIRCSTCEGKGEIKTICDKCEGNGIIKNLCVKCNGTGTLNTICDICHGVNSIIYHYPNYDSYVDTDPPASEPATNPISSYDWVTIKNPTCEESGTEYNYSTMETRSIPALGHNYSKEYTVDKGATCTEDGLKSRHCSRCGAHTDEVVIEKRGYHDWDNGRITKQPTCITEGIRTYQCKDCIQTKTGIIPALGHNFSYQYTFDKAATCTEDGSQSRHCTRCGAHTDEVVIEKHGHHTELVSNHVATYFAAGYTGDDICYECDTVITKGKAIAKLKLATPKVKITAGKQKLTVKYTKVKDATGFQVKYTYKGKTKTKNYTSKKSITKTIKK